MRASSTDLPNVLTGSFSRRLIADVFHGSDRVEHGLDVTAWSLTGDLTSDVKHSGSGTIVYASPDGTSFVPNGMNGVLSPYRAKLLLTLEIADDNIGFSESVTLGWFKVTSVPSGFDQYVDSSPGGRVVSASVVQVEFQSLDVNLKRRGFRSPEQPPSLLSCYDELRRISDMPVMETLPDKVLPKAITYDASDGGRLQGVQDIAQVLGGRAVPDSSGALTIIPPATTTPVGVLTVGLEGTVIDVGNSVDTDGVYNCVVGTFEDVNRNPIYSVATVNAGPLAVGGDYGEYTYYYSNDAINTRAAGDAAVRQVLSTSIGGQTYEVPIQCIINPLVELGDVLEVDGWDRPIIGQLIKYSMSDSALMNVTLEVSRPLT